MVDPLKISIASVFPSLYEPFIASSLIKRAQELQKVSFDIKGLFEYAVPKERIDAPTFGHGAGMLIKPDIIERVVHQQEAQHGKAIKVFFSPRGQLLTQRKVKHIAAQSSHAKHLLLLPARYEGMDARIEEEYADEILSIGDFVLMGGDLPAMMLIESVLRYIPGVVGRQESVEADSFSGPFVDYPEYTAPVVWRGKEVPEVIRSGDHQAIAQWRLDQAVKSTVLHHFQWLRSNALTADQKAISLKTMPSHYVVLMHSQVRTAGGSAGTTSVTSIDIHDIARSARTYGIVQMFIVTPLVDQQEIVRTLLDFWKEGPGVQYNEGRHQAVAQVQVCATLEEVCAQIKEKEGKSPLKVTTCARDIPQKEKITFYDQEKVWAAEQPVLFVFGTGQGLTDELIQQSDFLLVPIQGLSSFNHLSVRSAVAIILDRWMGINPHK